MKLQEELVQIFSTDYPGSDAFVDEVIKPIFGDDIDYVGADLAQRPEYAERARKAGLKSIKYIGDLTEQNYSADNIVLLDVTVDNNKNIERSRVNIQQLIRSIVQQYQHMLIVFHYEDTAGTPWRFSYAYKAGTIADSTSAKRYTYVFGRGYRGRTAAERFDILARSKRTNEDFEKAFSVEALSKEFFDDYRKLYADIVQYITGKRVEKVKGKWVDVKKHSPNAEIMAAFGDNEKRVRDYVKKMMGRLTFMYFIERKGWLNGNKSFMHDLFFKSDKQDSFLDDVLEPLFFGILNTADNREAVFSANGWAHSLLEQWKEIKYLNGGLFEQTDDDRVECRLPQKSFRDIFSFFDKYNFTIDENDPTDAEVGIDPEMLGRIFESLLEDNKDKGAFYTPKDIVQYMCKNSLKQYLLTKIPSGGRIIESLIDNHEICSDERIVVLDIEQALEAVKICDPAIGSGAFPMGLLNEILSCRRAIHHYLNGGDDSQFDSLAMKRRIIRNNIFGVDIEQGAVDIARLRFWLAIVLDSDEPQPLPNLDYTVVKGNSLLTTFHGETLDLPVDVDKRTKIGRELQELFKLQEKIYDQFGEPELETAVAIKLKLLKIIELQLGTERSDAQSIIYKTQDNFFEEDNARKKKSNAKAVDLFNRKSIVTGLINGLRVQLQADRKSMLKRAQTDIDFFDWKIMFSDIFANGGFDIVIGNPPYIKEGRGDHAIFEAVKDSPYYLGKMDIWYMFACRGIDMLKPDGNICFIATNNWTTSAGAKKLRNKIINETQIIQLCDFRDYMIFDSASIQTMVMQFKKNHTVDDYSFDLRVLLGNTLSDVIKMLSKDDAAPAEYLSPNIERNNYINHFLTFSAYDSLLSKIKKSNNCILLNDDEVSQGIVPNPDCVNSRNIKKMPSDIVKQYGIVPGSPVFVVPTDYFESLTDDEKKVLKPLYEPIDLTKYSIKSNSNEIIYLTRENSKDENLYPNLISHLKKFRPIMDERRETKQGRILYYQLHWSREENTFSQGEKIVVPRKCVYPTFTYTTKPAYVMMSMNIIMSKRLKLKYLSALLNSKLIEFWLRNKGKMQGLNFQLDKEPLQQIPIKLASINVQNRLAGILDNVIAAVAKQADADIKPYENQIDHIVYHLYELTYDEVLIVDPETPITREEYESFQL